MASYNASGDVSEQHPMLPGDVSESGQSSATQGTESHSGLPVAMDCSGPGALAKSHPGSCWQQPGCL